MYEATYSDAMILKSNILLSLYITNTYIIYIYKTNVLGNHMDSKVQNQRYT